MRDPPVELAALTGAIRAIHGAVIGLTHVVARRAVLLKIMGRRRRRKHLGGKAAHLQKRQMRRVDVAFERLQPVALAQPANDLAPRNRLLVPGTRSVGHRDRLDQLDDHWSCTHDHDYGRLLEIAMDRRHFVGVSAAASVLVATGHRARAQSAGNVRVLVFDVNETLLDLRALAPPFQTVFGDGALYSQWFAQVLQSALLTVAAGPYANFSQVARAALEMIAERRGVQLGDDDRSLILGTVRRLPSHPDVAPAFELLKEAGFRMATLTNSTPDVAEAQLTNAGLKAYLERVMSVDAVQSLKPAPKVYQYAAEQLGVLPGELRLVAAHSWDVAGAMRAGCKAAFVARPGMVLDPLYPAPDIVGPDVLSVARQIVALGG
jgi:2-haloacid dehalogenase